MRRTFRWRMSSTDDHTNDLCGGRKDIIADHKQVKDVMKNDTNDTNDMNTDENGEKNCNQGSGNGGRDDG